ADADAPAGRRRGGDLLDDPERLMPRDHRQPPAAHGALVLLDVAAADAARLDAQQRAVLRSGDHGAGKLAHLHLPGPGLDHGADHVSHLFYSRVLIGLGSHVSWTRAMQGVAT